jgi:hypothetical protein
MVDFPSRWFPLTPSGRFFHFKRDIFQHVGRSGQIGKRHVSELDLRIARVQPAFPKTEGFRITLSETDSRSPETAGPLRFTSFDVLVSIVGAGAPVFFPSDKPISSCCCSKRSSYVRARTRPAGWSKFAGQTAAREQKAAQSRVKYDQHTDCKSKVPDLDSAYQITRAVATEVIPSTIENNDES